MTVSRWDEKGAVRVKLISRGTAGNSGSCTELYICQNSECSYKTSSYMVLVRDNARSPEYAQR